MKRSTSKNDDTQSAVDNGQCGYFLLFDTRLVPEYWTYDPPENPNGLGWVTRKKFGGEFHTAPILADIMINMPNFDTWGGAHIDRESGKPEGGYFLFEDGHVLWYDISRIKLGGQYSYSAIQDLYYKLDDVR